MNKIYKTHRIRDCDRAQSFGGTGVRRDLDLVRIEIARACDDPLIARGVLGFIEVILRGVGNLPRLAVN